MSEVRRIDANALLADLAVQVAHHDAEALKHAQSGNEYPEGIHRNCAEKLRWCERLVKAAPTITAEGDGDAISREAAIDIIKRFGYLTVTEMIDAVDNLPSIPVTPAEVVTAEDICEGIRCEDADTIGFSTVKCGCDALVGLTEYDENQSTANIMLPQWMVADLLNGALRRGETVTWPKGHRLAKPEEPCLESTEPVADAREGLRLEWHRYHSGSWYCYLCGANGLYAEVGKIKYDDCDFGGGFKPFRALIGATCIDDYKTETDAKSAVEASVRAALGMESK